VRKLLRNSIAVSVTVPTKSFQIGRIAAHPHERRFDFRKSAFFIQPDFQYIIQPGGTSHLNNAVVFGSQFGINF
jgi:hypothetical protein